MSHKCEKTRNMIEFVSLYVIIAKICFRFNWNENPIIRESLVFLLSSVDWAV